MSCFAFFALPLQLHPLKGGDFLMDIWFSDNIMDILVVVLCVLLLIQPDVLIIVVGCVVVYLGGLFDRNILCKKMLMAAEWLLKKVPFPN